MACRWGRRVGDGGQATVLMVAAVGLVAVMLLSLGPMGRALGDRARARTAADAAALAGAAEGEAAAREVASANGARLVGYEEVGAVLPAGREVVVEVVVGQVTAHARARARLGAASGTVGAVGAAGSAGAAGAGADGSGRLEGLAPAMRAALAAAERLLGHPVPVVSGYRSPAQQQELWERRHGNPFPVAPPGRSAHERGLAIDVARHAVDDVRRLADQVHLCQPLPRTDPVHFELCGS